MVVGDEHTLIELVSSDLRSRGALRRAPAGSRYLRQILELLHEVSAQSLAEVRDESLLKGVGDGKRGGLPGHEPAMRFSGGDGGNGSAAITLKVCRAQRARGLRNADIWNDATYISRVMEVR